MPEKEVLIIASKVKEAVKASGCQTSGDLVQAISDKVYQMLEVAVERAKANGRATVRPYDL